MRNIWAVGRNYSDHAKELGNEVPQEPFIFLKSGSCLVLSKDVVLPAWTTDVHYEGELALRFSKTPDEGFGFDQVHLALDLTERSKQSALKKQGLPWTLAKSFTNSCPLSKGLPLSSLEEFSSLSFTLSINGVLRQKGTPSEMIFGIDALKTFVLTHFPVQPGDLLLTGTPAGTGPLLRGDEVSVQLFTGTRMITAQASPQASLRGTLQPSLALEYRWFIS